MADTLDLSQFTTVWDESFDNGFGRLDRVWGPGVHVADGAVTLNNTPDNQDSGAMVAPTGADAGNGYGLYSFTLKMEQGDAPGPYALLWPATDVWPGPELDVLEVLDGGQGYSTVHWKGDGNSNQFTSRNLDGIDVKQVHTYALDWEQGRLTMYVDGKQMWTTTDNVPNDAAHGGENSAPGVGMQTWWAAGSQHGGGYANSMTVYDVNYAAPNSGYHDGTGTGSSGTTPVDTGTGSAPQTGTTPVTLAPVTQTIGSGADSLVLKISQDAYQGNAQYTVSVDGKQVGEVLTAGASHAAGQDDTIAVQGDFGAGSHTVTVTFVNDAWDGTPDTDRNLYVDGISHNGAAVENAAQALYSAGPADFAFA